MKNNLLRVALVLLVVSVWTTGFAQQAKPADVKTVVSQGRLNGSEYTNDYFHVIVRIPTPNTWLRANSTVNDNRAQLVEAVNSQGSPEQRHNFVLIMQSDKIPGLTSTAQYVRSVRHNYEREGFRTVTAETPVNYAGKDFIVSILKQPSAAGNLPFYKGICVTRVNGYLFGFWVEASDEQQLKKIMDLSARLQFR